MRAKESCAFWPSRVLVWSHSSPRAMRSAAGVATTPQRPGIRLPITAWPDSGDRVLPSDSYFGQVTIMPVMPVAFGSVDRVVGVAPVVALSSFLPIGHASSPLFGSFVPARLLL